MFAGLNLVRRALEGGLSNVGTGSQLGTQSNVNEVPLHSNDDNKHGANDSLTDPENSSEISLDVVYILVAATAALVLLGAVLLLIKILRGHIFCRRRSNLDPLAENGVTLGEVNHNSSKTKRSSKKRSGNEDPLRKLIVPDIKIMDEDGNVVPRASFS